MNEEHLIHPMQANSLFLTKSCEINGILYLLKNKYRQLADLYEAEKNNNNLVIGRGKFFFYVLTPDKK